MELAGRVVSQRRIEPVLVSRLDNAGLLLKPGEWTLIHLGAGVFGALLFLLLSGGGIVATVLGLALGLIVPQVYLVLRRSRRERVPQPAAGDAATHGRKPLRRLLAVPGR